MNFFQAATGVGGRGNGGRGVGAAPALTTPREAVPATFHKSRVVVLHVPFQTPRASAIRQFVAARLLNENNQRLFVFRTATGNTWTNISLASTPTNPALTAEPAEIARKLTTILTTCTDVSTVTLHNEEGAVITAEQVSNMTFDDLQDQAAAAPTDGNTQADVTVAQLHQVVRDTYSKIEEIGMAHSRALVQLDEKIDRKMNYIIDVLEKTVREPDPEAPHNRTRVSEFVHPEEEDEEGDERDETEPQIEEVNEEDLEKERAAGGGSSSGTRHKSPRASAKSSRASAKSPTAATPVTGGKEPSKRQKKASAK